MPNNCFAGTQNRLYPFLFLKSSFNFELAIQGLGQLRMELFPNVALMLLTATATPRVRDDILIQMRLKSSFSNQFTHNNFANTNNTKVLSKLNARTYNNNNNNNNSSSSFGGIGNPDGSQVAFFMQSFNRENLQYRVEVKQSNQWALDKICRLVKERYARKSGIVYCISRQECEDVAALLRKQGIQALAYHAGMEDQHRADTQSRWSNNMGCSVVCATIAFGMGIDKA